MTRRLRKHRTALIALAVYNFVLFFPIAFMGRVVSPNDVFYNYSPWSTFRPAEVLTQNSTMNDPPTAYFTLMTLAREDWRAFHWNPYIASGIPGFGSSASAILSPFILLPALLVPSAWIYTVILFLKLNASFLFAYFWLREERLGRHGAAVGATVIAGAGVYAVRWLWQITNATVLYPALLWVVRRAMNGKRVPVPLVALLALAYALSGFPAAIAYGAWLVLAYSLWNAGVQRGLMRAGGRRRSIASAVLGVVIALMIATPSLIPFAQFLRRSGYLDMRKEVTATVFPPDHWRSFIDPDRLGHPSYRDWTGDRRLGPLNNYTETTVYLGLLTIPLALLGFIRRRRMRARWFWLGCAAFVLACMFGAPYIAPWVSKIPGFKFSSLTRVGLLLPLAIGYLAAAGTRLVRKPVIVMVFAVLIAYDLAVVAGRFYPYLEPRQATLPATPMVEFLRHDRGPFRIAPFFDYLWPNAAEMVRVEDVRSHFSSERDYRRLLQRLDPTSWGGTSTLLTFNSLHYNFDDPLNAMLGIRWFIEHNQIDIIKWGIFKATVPGVTQTGSMQFRPGDVMEQTIRVDAEPFWAIELPVDVTEARGRDPRLEVTLLKDGAAIWARAFTNDDTHAVDKVYVPLRQFARLGDTLRLHVRSVGMSGWMPQSGNTFFYGRVTTPVIFDRKLPDGKLFRNLAELPRFRAVSKLRKLNDDEFLAARDVNFEHEAVITDDPVQAPSLTPTQARLTLTYYTPDEQRVTAESPAPFYLASSEKLTPELRVTIDGRTARAIETDMLFAGVTVPAGRHEIMFQRRIARGWWWVAVLGVALWIVSIIFSRRRG